MKKVLAAVFLAIIAAVVSEMPVSAARSSSKPSGQAATSNLVSDEAREAALRDVHEQETAAVKPLFTQEHSEVAAVQHDKRMSATKKRDAEKAIRKKYLDQRNAARLRIRTELRAKLLQIPQSR